MSGAMIITAFGFSINLISLLIILLIIGLVVLFIRIQLTDRLDFADMLTKNGKTVSLTKVLQLLGGTTATWVIIKLASTGTLGVEMFGVYLAYVGSIEGWSKFVSAKYGYKETSGKKPDPTGND
jgi:hypothetical protein